MIEHLIIPNDMSNKVALIEKYWGHCKKITVYLSESRYITVKSRDRDPSSP